jgi:CRISPR/Cas system-associated protein Csm6
MKKSFEPWLVISTVGTSLLTNQLTEGEKRKGWGNIIRDTANLIEAECDLTTKKIIDELASRSLSELRTRDILGRRRLSAELNGLYALYDDNFTSNKNDMHFLVATDTYQGIKTADTIKQFLLKEGFNIDINIPPKLSTLNTVVFSQGIKELIRWCGECISGFKGNGYHTHK